MIISINVNNNKILLKKLIKLAEEFEYTLYDNYTITYDSLEFQTLHKKVYGNFPIPKNQVLPINYKLVNDIKTLKQELFTANKLGL